MWAGVVSGSVALMSDAWHSLSDSVSSIVVIIGAKISGKTSNEKYPFGFGRAEVIATLVIGVMLGLMSINFFSNSIGRIASGETANFGSFAIIITIITIAIKEVAAQFAFYGHRRTGYLSLNADGWHHRTDAVALMFILGGIVLSKYIPHVDGFLGIIVASLIGRASFKILKKASQALIGKAADRETITQLNEVAQRASGMKLDLEHIHLHVYGSHTEVTFHVNLPPELSMADANRIVQSISNEVKTEMHFEATIQTGILNNK